MGLCRDAYRRLEEVAAAVNLADPHVLRARLSEFDGKDTSPLAILVEQLTPGEEFVDLLIELVEEGERAIQVAGTWVLRRLFDSEIALTREQRQGLLDLLTGVSDWECRLHLLQLFPRLEVPKARATALFDLFMNDSAAPNKFVRAWGYNALVCLADQHRELREQVTEMIESAASSESASIKARIRNVRKEMSWLR